MNYKIKVNGAEYEVNIQRFEGTTAQLTVNDVEFDVEVEGLFANPTRMSPATKTTAYKPAAKTAEVPIVKPKTSGSYELKSPLPGIILEILVKEGDTVKAGQQVLVLEAMKMENSIQTDREGIVEKINRSAGDSVLEGDVILIIK